MHIEAQVMLRKTNNFAVALATSLLRKQPLFSPRQQPGPHLSARPVCLSRWARGCASKESAQVRALSYAGRDVLEAALPYIYDVRRRCDNNIDIAADLAVALGNFANEFASGFMLGNFWLIYWNQLSEFDGYDSQCW